jgi:signal transduction histidine kinase
VYDKNNEPLRIIGTVTDVTEKKELEKQKDEFISTVSHELKTPVTSIKAYNQFLQRTLKSTGDEQSINFLVRMDVQINRLQTLIQTLLDITRVEQNKLRLEEDTLELNLLTAEVTADMQLITPSHKLDIIQNTAVKVKADRNRLIQVITNLITNAVKYSPDSNKVNISLTQEDDRALFSIKDFGIGIQQEHHSLIFERFHQANHNNPQAGLSLGLGLYISKEIITKAGGQLWFESEVGKGSTFYFSLPCLPKDSRA